MDAISVVGLVESSLSLALQFGSAAKLLNDIAGKYKNATLATRSLAQNLDMLQLTWAQVTKWFETCSDDPGMGENDFVKRGRGFLETGTLVMEALEQDLLTYDVENLTFTQRSKLIWNENTLQGHQIRIRDQTLSMILFLEAVKLPTPQARANLLRKSEDQFQKSDESAYSIDSIVPSQVSLSTVQRRSLANSSHGSLEYRPLGFENILFMSKAYVRNSKNMMIKKLFRVGIKSKGKMKEVISLEPSSEAIGKELDTDSSSGQVSIEDDLTDYLIKPDKSPTPIFEQLLLGVANYINSHIAPWDTQTLTPVKLAAFYRLVGGDLDPFFLDTPQDSLSFSYQRLGCYHTLEPEKDPYTPPATPALTPAGFVRWQLFRLLLDPEQHVPFLQQAVKRFDLTNPADGAPFPRVLPKESLPHQPDMEVVEWYENTKEDVRLEARASAWEVMPPRPSLTLNDTDLESFPISQANTGYRRPLQYLFRSVKRATPSGFRGC